MGTRSSFFLQAYDIDTPGMALFGTSEHCGVASVRIINMNGFISNPVTRILIFVHNRNLTGTLHDSGSIDVSL